jgi:uncharacterized membrane-anchored protein YhcB (DUF1043 family)
MLELIVAFVVGVIVGGVGMFFVAKNNQEKFAKALNSDTKAIVDQILAEVDEEGKAKELVEKLKAKLDK